MSNQVSLNFQHMKWACTLLCVKFICSDCHAKDSEGKRPLHFAAYGKGSHARDVVDVLIEKGATEIGELRFGIIGLHGMQRDFCVIYYHKFVMFAVMWMYI